MATKKKRRMRLPNGLGSVHKIGDGKQRRRPWRARVPSHLEFDPEKGKATQKYITLGYYETEADAIAALFEYRKDPYTIEAATATFSDVYEMWSERKYKEIGDGNMRNYKTSYTKHSVPLHDMKMRDIRAVHMSRIIAEMDAGNRTQVKTIQLWSQLFRFAMENDIVQKNYAEFVKPKDKAEETKRTAISDEDISALYAEADKGNMDAKIALIYIYTGFRAAELLEEKKENIDISNRLMIGGAKTEAGKNRKVPIHKDILPYIEELMVTDGDYLISKYKRGAFTKYAYNDFRLSRWDPLMNALGMDYTMHYTRHTCATIMRKANIPEDIRKLILGHATGDVTARYTHISDQMLVEAIDMIPSRKDTPNVTG